MKAPMKILAPAMVGAVMLPVWSLASAGPGIYVSKSFELEVCEQPSSPTVAGADPITCKGPGIYAAKGPGIYASKGPGIYAAGGPGIYL